MEEKKRVEITDITKLRPELIELPLPEVQRRKAELQMAEDYLMAKEKKKQEEAALEEAKSVFDDMVDAIVKLQKLGYLPERIAKVLTDENGSFQPGRYLKAPRKAKAQDSASPDTAQ